MSSGPVEIYVGGLTMAHRLPLQPHSQSMPQAPNSLQRRHGLLGTEADPRRRRSECLCLIEFRSRIRNTRFCVFFIFVCVRKLEDSRVPFLFLGYNKLISSVQTRHQVFKIFRRKCDLVWILVGQTWYGFQITLSWWMATKMVSTEDVCTCKSWIIIYLI